ncbi:MAG: DJ-1/PfpI family protein [Spirochaetia bacterium]|nr:DJ-1/PfpI family protein [Spirochaetia bacterium]
MKKRVNEYLLSIEAKGIELQRKDGALLWTGDKPGSVKTYGPLVGKKIGCLITSEFSDFQAYYIAAYIGEFGGALDFILVDDVSWHWTRPNNRQKGVQGLWGLSVDPIPVGGGEKADTAVKVTLAVAEEYDALIILGGPSGDIMSTEKPVQDLLLRAYNNGAVLGGIGGGIIPLITVGLTDGKKCTGNEQVDFMLKRKCDYSNDRCVLDERILTAQDTVDTPEFVSELCSFFDNDYVDNRKDMLKGKRMLLIAGWDFEDFEIAVPALEFLHRGSELIIGTFTGCKRSRPPLLGVNVVQGNFGMSVPLQEINDDLYQIKDLRDISHEEYDGLMIPGSFCPWNMIEAGYPLTFLQGADESGNMIAFMCHGPIAVAAAGLAENKKSTGWLSCLPAFNSMGGDFQTEWAAVIDGNMVSGRTTPELPEFIDAMSIGLLTNGNIPD